MPGIRANAAPYEAYPADLAAELPTSTLADTKHTKGDDSPTAIFPTTRTKATHVLHQPPASRHQRAQKLQLIDMMDTIMNQILQSRKESSKPMLNHSLGEARNYRGLGDSQGVLVLG